MIAGLPDRVPLDTDLLARGGAVTDPHARAIDPRRCDRRRYHRRTDVLVWTVLYGLLVVIPWVLLFGLVYLIARAAAQLWRLAEPLLTVLAVGVALGVIVVGLGLPG